MREVNKVSQSQVANCMPSKSIKITQGREGHYIHIKVEYKEKSDK